MLYCSNPHCSNTFNPDGNKFCIHCGQTLTPLFRNRFRVIRLLGEGGFGKTYEARDTDKMDEPCVIKQFFPQVQGTAALEKATELFKQEAKRLYELGEHPQIPRLIAYFEQDKRLYLVQEFINGQNLLEELQQQGTFSEEKIIQLLNDLLPVLQFIHERGVIHRDIKPENIMRRQQDGKFILIDFGVSKQTIGSIIGQVGTTVGTPGYAPVEQMRGQVFPASDLYSLGVTCIRLLTGCLPNGGVYDSLYDALKGKWIWRECLPFATIITPILAQILDNLLQDYVTERYQSAAQVIQVITPPNLRSAVGMNYKILQDLLISQKWREADQETWKVMLKISNREKERYLRVEHIKSFPCQDLLTIDGLWLLYSNGRFGFSIQKQLWERVGGKADLDLKTWNYFGECLGWRSKNKWEPYEDLSFTLASPAGHLPRAIWSMRLDGRRKRLSALTSRLTDCQI
ncbi:MULTISPECIES: serine/threonine-protein kinase [Calothrix]|uniref:non-specific serine/threonine protein kinase n=2 Tax=Calothrix TaxID=1186 RepID=A0ABR8AD34_9CYAN|nr:MULTISPECIES: serine/threonine-protein kinase [Calothrix]MBD2197922.1 GUN4 domain-containing protein [Calothrix parietina FACHB-288]MBD2226793.1 GUN4 domain-containing protein [Calothrix anomala FACHB-343]